METLTKFNDQLLGAPAGVLLFIGCIALGWALKIWPNFNNQKIPAVVIIVGLIGFPILSLGSLPSPAPVKVLLPWLFRYAAIGLIIGLAAWIAHNKALKRLEDKIPVLKDWLDDSPQSTDKPSTPPTS